MAKSTTRDEVAGARLSAPWQPPADRGPLFGHRPDDDEAHAPASVAETARLTEEREAVEREGDARQAAWIAAEAGAVEQRFAAGLCLQGHGEPAATCSVCAWYAAHADDE